VADGATTVRQWNGTLAPTPAGWNSPAYTWDGLNSSAGIVATATEVKPFTLKLLVQPEPYGDPGYLAPPSNIVPTTPVTIDTQNPTLVNGAGSSINAQRKITLDGDVRVVPELDNTMTFTCFQRFLPATIGGNGWNVWCAKMTIQN
jgi:hypothetical protein